MNTRIREIYNQYVKTYYQFLKRRGYGKHNNDWPFYKRSFLTCWTEPGFHRFWRIWNPGISFFPFQLYRWLGGNRNRIPATILAFVVCGLAHNIVVFLFLGWSFTLPVAFFSFSILSLLSWYLRKPLRQDLWPAGLNIALNLVFVIASFKLGFYINTCIYYACNS